MKTKKEKQYLSIEDARPRLDTWAAEQNDIFAARQRIVDDPRLLGRVFRAAGKGLRVAQGSERGAEELRARSKRVQDVVIAAVKKVGLDHIAYFAGQRFRRQAACKRVLERLSTDLATVLNAEGKTASLSNFLRWTTALKEWSLVQRDRELLADDHLDPARRVYREEMSRRNRR